MMGHNQGPPLDDVPEIPLGPKTGIYAEHMDPTKVNPTTGTNDIWHARAMGYTKDGEPWSAALTPQQHAFLDAETVKAVGRMNEKAVGGRTDWTPGEVQAAPWVTGKARGLKQQRPSLTDEEAMAEAIKSYPENFDKYTFNQTYELTPGVMTGHRPDIATGTQQLKEAYANDPRIQWTDPDKRDIINEALGIWQRPTQRATGLYTPPGGQPEVNPGFVARPVVGIESGGTGVRPRDLATMKGVQAFRASWTRREPGPARCRFCTPRQGKRAASTSRPDDDRRCRRAHARRADGSCKPRANHTASARSSTTAQADRC